MAKPSPVTLPMALAENPPPGVVVFHEASGLGAHARDKAELLAKAGYVALAADLFGGVAKDLSEATGYITRLSSEPGLLHRRCTAAFDLLAAQPNVDASRMAAIGFCFGGQRRSNSRVVERH